jgi:hypothetical protein
MLELHALGQETGVRAAELVSILDTLSGEARRAALDEVVSRPWPAAGQEGLDIPVQPRHRDVRDRGC